jgi:hypothetical protein
MIERLMDRPTPVPVALVGYDNVNNRSMSTAARPMPLSLTATYRTRRGEGCRDLQPPYGWIDGVHRVDGIDNQTEQDLLELDAVTLHRHERQGLNGDIRGCSPFSTGAARVAS